MRFVAGAVVIIDRARNLCWPAARPPYVTRLVPGARRAGFLINGYICSGAPAGGATCLLCLLHSFHVIYCKHNMLSGGRLYMST